MGGSGHGGGGGGGGIWVDNDNCGGEFAFWATVSAADMEAVWDACIVGDLVVIQSSNDTIPRMHIIRELDGFIIGVVPASAAGLFNCIISGWTYRGKVIVKIGNEHNPRIKVTVKGER